MYSVFFIVIGERSKRNSISGNKWKSEIYFLLASEQSERDSIRGVQIRACAVCIYICVYTYICVWRYVCHNSSACRAYVMWAELVHCHFLNVPAVLNEVTTGNGTGTKNVLKLEMCSVSTNGERATPA